MISRKSFFKKMITTTVAAVAAGGVLGGGRRSSTKAKRVSLKVEREPRSVARNSSEL